MALTIGQIAAASYPAIVAEARKAANQWVSNALFDEMERQGFIERKSLGATIEVPLDYRSNPDAGFLTELQLVGMAKTEILTSASYEIAELGVPVKWSKKDEVKNPSENQKIALVKQLVMNALDSHDDQIEQALFTTTTQDFVGLLTHITDAGTGSDGGIDSSAETWDRNQQSTYVDDTDIEAAFTQCYNNAGKGSGDKITPTLMVSDGATQAIFEGTQQAQQRWAAQDLKAGFTTIGFKAARYIYSNRASTRVFFLNPKSLKLVASKEYWRDREETQPLENQNGFSFKIYSALQLVAAIRSRLGVAHV